MSFAHFIKKSEFHVYQNTLPPNFGQIDVNYFKGKILTYI